ncbi:glutamyl-tRNA reductase 2, chloroplastic-like [Dorcoceras hygrometricum]|uniref:Glutamyl-tRNA reductase 2, chloroplastic-like n=1 Tax=Dorcoceras hygrometricum TaxID=472368 RepID=A0A2Z7AGH3_9LAMI|nr:glutamyl-tRNA reductase 2, chloroplastic-like [Dorcoceras hygrometricum]
MVNMFKALESTDLREPTKIKFGLGIEMPGVNDGDWYKASLPQIVVNDKGKAPLVVKDEIKGHPAREKFSLICADIEFPVQLRVKVIDEIVSFFSLFSLHRLAALGPLADIAAKEEQILAWAEIDSLQTAMRVHKLEWSRLFDSKLFEGDHIDRGAVIARYNTNIRLKIFGYQFLVSGFYVSRKSNSGVDQGLRIRLWYVRSILIQQLDIHFSSQHISAVGYSCQ